MKNNFKKLFSKPKYTIIVALILAIAGGVAYSSIQKSNRAKLFANNPLTTDTSSTSTNQKDLTLAFATGGRIKSVAVKIGDSVKAGQVLASIDAENVLGAINQAKGAYAAAQTNYTKLVNGATNTDIQVARVGLANAKSNYENVVSQQKVLVSNTLSAMLNSNLVALPLVTNNANAIYSPIVSGTYSSDQQGTYTIVAHTTGNGFYFTYSGLESGTANVGNTPVALGTRGLFLQFPSNFSVTGNSTWTIAIPNTESSNYLSTYNAYQSALQTQTTATTAAQGAIDAAQANLDQKISGARIEDLAIAQAQVQSTQGALQIAQGAYNNTIITAPVDGVITNVSITAGQIATPNTPAIELLSK